MITIREEQTEKNSLDALDFYTSILKKTKEVLGEEKMTEPVIVKLLETASYVTWRNIMGGKYKEEDWTPVSSDYGRKRR